MTRVDAKAEKAHVGRRKRSAGPPAGPARGMPPRARSGFFGAQPQWLQPLFHVTEPYVPPQMTHLPAPGSRTGPA